MQPARIIVFTINMLLISVIANGQVIQQTIKGRIIDQDSKSPVIGANIIIMGSEPLQGSSTDINGEFKIDDVTIGRITLIISNIGYEDKILHNIDVGAGKEVSLEIAMVEAITKLDEIIFKAQKNKAEIQNDMVMVSARSFSVEETNRYAGSFNDPARMVSSFAGIQGNAEGGNHIVVRGNSPNTVQWRLDGIEIPNPNHFSEEGSSGGAINVLNGAMLSNSDFYTSAFSPEYGNVMGGVFDMRLRSGNKDKREYSLSAGILGTDITIEGPFSKKGKSTYLANYRYSTLSILNEIGLVDYNGIPKYQDLSFKLGFPTNKLGRFTLFGLGGASGINEEIIDDETEEVLAKGKYNSTLGTVNLNHFYFFNNSSSIESFVSISQNGNTSHSKEKNEQTGIFEDSYIDDLQKYTVRLNTSFNTKINSRNTFKTGISYSKYYFTFTQKFANNSGDIETLLDDSDNTGMLESFATWKHRLNENLTITGGLHYSYLLLNGSQAFEPRVAAKFQLPNNQSVFAGIGMHSQMASLPVYFSQIDLDGNGLSTPNLDLGLMKAIHYVAGYDKLLNPNLYFKVEIYYQDLYDIPVENSTASSYSLLNALSGFTDRALVNEGFGSNYGVELTMEKYFNNNFYYLFTGSFYNSNYKALDGIERSTRFNSNYLTNLLVGKEFIVGDRNKNKKISLNVKIVFGGPSRFTPIDLEKSNDLGWTVWDEANAYSLSGDQFTKIDFSISYNWNKKKTRQEIKLDIVNVTNNDTKISEYYNSLTQEIETSTQLPLLPVLLYTIQF